MIIHVYSFSFFVSSKTRYHAVSYYIESSLLKILLKTLTRWAQRDKTLQEKVTFTDTKKIAQNYSIPGGTLDK